MKCVFGILLTLFVLLNVGEADQQIKDQLQNLTEQLESLKSSYETDIAGLKQEVDDLKQSCSHTTTNYEQNEQTTLDWAKSSMKELRVEMRELNKSINNSALLRQLHTMHNELKQAVMEAADLAQLTRMQEARIDKLDNEVGRLKYEDQQVKNMIAEIRAHIGKITKQIKVKAVDDLNPASYNTVTEDGKIDNHEHQHSHSHRLRHNKMIHTQILRIAEAQEQLDEYQQGMLVQLLDVQRRLDRFEEPNWNLLSAKVDILELEHKVLRDEVRNNSQKISDFDKMHKSLLELREDVESLENKEDKIIPEFRKEISKLDISYAQLNAQTSYLKEDQENLRQSVKAIAVSVSNAVDRAEMDRHVLHRINDSIAELDSRSKYHFHRLNDHILKSEANTEPSNRTNSISWPELIGEVKELQSIGREYMELVGDLPGSCSEVDGPAGIYMVRPSTDPIEAWCDAGKTLLQRRCNGSVEFNRKFDEYVHGFGDPTSEYWLGLQTMHDLTFDNCSSMRIDMTDIYGGNWYAEYQLFSVGSAENGFMLEVNGFKGNASDAFEYQNLMQFSAIDRDRDISNTHCAGNYEGGWWYSHCQHVNINGKYTLGLTWFDSNRNEWIAVATSVMQLFRRPGCT